MSLLSELMTVCATLKIPAETGAFTQNPAPDLFAVLTPMEQEFFAADDSPEYDVQNVRVTLYQKGAYTATANSVVRAILAAGAYITDRRYIGRDDDTGINQYAIDAAQKYEWEEN